METNGKAPSQTVTPGDYLVMLVGHQMPQHAQWDYRPGVVLEVAAALLGSPMMQLRAVGASATELLVAPRSSLDGPAPQLRILTPTERNAVNAVRAGAREVIHGTVNGEFSTARKRGDRIVLDLTADDVRAIIAYWTPKAKPEHTHIAMDANGEVWAYTSEPKDMEDGLYGWRWLANIGAQGTPLHARLSPMSHKDDRRQPISKHWRSSLTKLPARPDAEGWIEWAGGQCPVDAGTLVDLKFKSGVASSRRPPAGNFRWEHVNSGGDIVAYRVAAVLVDAPKQPESDEAKRERLEANLKAAAEAVLDHMGADGVQISLGEHGKIRVAKDIRPEFQSSMARGDEVRTLREKVAYLDKELERERTCHAACGTVSLANTRESLKRTMDGMHVDYKSPAVTDVAQAVRREIEYRERAEKAEALLAAAEIAPVSTVEGVRQWREGVRALREKAGCMQNDLNTAASTIASLQEQLRQRTAERDALNAKLDPLGDEESLREQALAWQAVFATLTEVWPKWTDEVDAINGLERACEAIRRLNGNATLVRCRAEAWEHVCVALGEIDRTWASGNGSGMQLAAAKIRALAHQAARVVELEARQQRQAFLIEGAGNAINLIRTSLDLSARVDPLGPGMGKGEVASIELLKRENHSLRARLTVMEANCPPRRLTLSRDAAPGNEPSETAGMPVPGPVDLGGLLNQIADAIGSPGLTVHIITADQNGG